MYSEFEDVYNIPWSNPESNKILRHSTRKVTVVNIITINTWIDTLIQKIRKEQRVKKVNLWGKIKGNVFFIFFNFVSKINIQFLITLNSNTAK